MTVHNDNKVIPLRSQNTDHVELNRLLGTRWVLFLFGSIVVQ